MAVTQMLAVEGVTDKNLHRYTIRWTQEGEDSVPVLYYDGKRVTKRWYLILAAESPADPHGGNANTD